MSEDTSWTEPALDWAAFRERLASAPEYTLHVSRHIGAQTEAHESAGERRHAVVMLHGLAASSWSWHDVVASTPTGYESICIDLLGHGQSPKPRHRAFSVYDHARHVVHAIESLGLDTVSLVGNSLGGGCAVLAAAVLHQRQSVRVNRIVSLEGIGVRQRIPLAFWLVRLPLLPELFKNLVPAKLRFRAVLRICYADPSRVTEEQVAAYALPAKDPAHSLATINSARYLKPHDLDELPARYRAIRAPTLLIWGDKGNIVPREVGETLDRVLPNSTLHVQDDCGHIPHEERPQVVVPMIWDFLQRKNESGPGK